MATDKYAAVQEGDIAAGIFVSMIADELVKLWSPVIVVTNPSITNGLPRVEPINVTNNPNVLGIAVGGTGKIENGNAAEAAGDTVMVQIFGLAKCVVDGNVANIAIGDNLVTDNTDGVARKVEDLPAIYSASNLARHVFAKALQLSTVDLDTIAVYITGGSQ